MRTRIPILAALVVVVAATALVLGAKPTDDLLVGATWRWTSTMAAGAAEPSAVPDPSAYTLEFKADRTFQAKADCNVASGTYRRVPPGRTGPLTRLTITLGPSEPVACGAGSLSEAYLRSLASAWSYTVADGGLTIVLSDGGSMTFR